MKTLTQTICLSCFVLAEAQTGAGGAELRTDINPAAQYYQAFIVAPDFSQADRDFLFTNEWRGQKLPERFGALVARYDNEFRLARQAAQATSPCDWGIDFSPGPATLLPHLARNKSVAQAARLRALWALQQGRPAEARDDLLAAFALGRNSSRDGTVISALVQIAVENIVCSTVAENFHLFPTEILSQLADGFDAAPARMRMSECLGHEKKFFVDWIIGKVLELQNEHPGNDAKAMAAIRELCDSTQGPEEGQPTPNKAKLSFGERVAKAAGGTSDGVLKLLRQGEPYYQKFAKIMALPPAEYEDQINEFMTEVRNSPNPFIVNTLPALEKVRPKEFAVLAQLAMVRAAVEYKLHGEPGLKSVIDPVGQSPFAMERFSFEGVDRGFSLKSTYNGRGFPEVLIFVEKDGHPFVVSAKNAGQALGGGRP